MKGVRNVGFLGFSQDFLGDKAEYQGNSKRDQHEVVEVTQDGHKVGDQVDRA